VGPVGAFDQDIRQHGCDEFARRFFVEESDRIHGFEGGGKLGPFALSNERPGRTLQPLDAGVGVQSQDQNVAQRPGAFEQANVARMQDIVAAVGKNHLPALAPPLLAYHYQLVPGVYRAQCLFYFAGSTHKYTDAADKDGMSTNSINNLSSSYLQSILENALQSNGVTNNQSNHTLSALQSLTNQPDIGQLSPFAQLASTLQQLQQSNPTPYQQVTQTIATNLTTAAQTAATDGNTGAAAQLTQLASDFTSASKTGQLPNLQDLAQATGGTTGHNGTNGASGHHHHHHHHSEAASSSSSTTSSDDSSLNPLNIIAQTLTSAGITGSNG
jgi:hypothetical protein